MDAATQTLKRIFELDRRYLVPLFQRPYVWRAEAQWQPLWEDVRDVADRLAAGVQTVRPHFLGAIVLDHLRQPSSRVEARLVVDGQQRLTTLQLLLEAASDICQQRGWENYRRAFVKLTRNEDPLSNDPDDVFKGWPTNVDREAFRRVMDAQSDDALKVDLATLAGGIDSPIAQAYLFFSVAIREWLPEDGDGAKCIGNLYTTLRELIRLVVIDLGETDDPQLIFETLNARGTPLLPADLIKNHFFHLAERSGASVERLHRLHWKHFDEEATYWRAEIATGRVKRSRIDLFLQHYLAMETGEEVQVSHLYAAFQNYVGRSQRSLEDQLASVAGYSRVFRGFDEFDPKSRIGLFFSRLEDLQVTTAHPLLLYLFGRNLGVAEVEAALVDIESLLVRRLVCHLTTKNYNHLFLDALNAIRGESTDVPRALRSFLAQAAGDSVRWPSDDELREAWMEMPTYKTQARRRTRMLLEALELASRGPKTESLGVARNLTIEHVLPQSWEGHWQLDPARDRAEARGERDRMLHTLGNLTLLTKALNPSVSNGAWATKRSGIGQHSVLMLNNGLSDLPHWDEQAIRARGAGLYALARSIWPRPAQQTDAVETPGSYLAVAKRLAQVSPEKAPDEALAVRCPIPGCDHLFKKSLAGWDGHVSSLKKHPSWQPDVPEPAARRALFRAEFPGLLPEGEAGETSVGREYWERRADPGALTIADGCGALLDALGSTPHWLFSRHYIGLGDSRRTLAKLRPQRSSACCGLRIRTERHNRDEQLVRLRRAGIRMTVNKKGPPSLDLTHEDLEAHRELLQELFASAIRRAEE